MSYTRTLVALSCAISLWTLGASVLAQTPPAGAPAQPPPPPQNLQVLPKDTPRAELTAIMRGFTQGLGVQCSHCHVAEGRGGRNDYAADEKPAKQTARAMIRMTTQINQTLGKELGKPAASITTVSCATCHRGAAIPVVTPPAAAAPAH